MRASNSSNYIEGSTTGGGRTSSNEAEVEAAEDAACAAVTDLEALHDTSVGNSASADGSTNNELRLAKEAA
jgi:hypothetical protein